MRFPPRALHDVLIPEYRTPGSKVVWSLRAVLASLAVFSLSTEPQHTTRTLLFTSAGWGLGMSVLFAFVPTTRPRTLKAAEAATLAAVAMHVMGHAFGWYEAFRGYDTMLHFFVPFAIVFILYGLSQAANWIWDWQRVSAVEVAIYLFAMSVALGTLWEVAEFGMDRIFGTREQDGLSDTMIDLIMDVLGAAVGAVSAGIATAYGRRRGFDRISEPPKRPYPMRAPRGASKE